MTTDAIGNLTNDGTWSYTWQHGRQLKQMSRPDASGDTEMVCFRYDSSGHRISKDSGVYHASYSGGEIVYAGETTRTSYSYLGDTLTQVRIVEPNSSATLHFTYDEIGPMSVTYDGVEYFYLKNAQGDVTGLVNNSGAQVVAYTYDAWGNPLTTTGTMADTLGKLNPFRYRGYVYDTETGLYYLQSRYYNPETGRFINADSYALTGQGVLSGNMFAYVLNNPLSYSDHSGNFALTIGTAIVLLASAALAYLTAKAITSPKVRKDVAKAANYVYNKVREAVSSTWNSAKSPTNSANSKDREKTEEKAAAKTDSRGTKIYRYGGTNPGNLTPREKDRYTGLSFSTIPIPGAAETTIEALNATMTVYAVQDSPTHVSVRPINGTMSDWIEAGSSSRWTAAVNSVVVKWDGRS